MFWKKFASYDAESSLAELQSSVDGLSEESVRSRFSTYGKNEMGGKRSFISEALRRRFKSSFLYLLLAAAVLSLFLGDRIDAILIALFVAINIGLETYQEYRSERSAELLKKYLIVRVHVRRDGRMVMTEGKNIVPGDIVLVEPGDRLPADIRFIKSDGIEVDESVMTGESVAVAKTAALPEVPPTEMYEATNIGFAGTVVTAGRGEGVVFATGRDMALGDIAALTEGTDRETVFEKGMARFSRFLVRLVLLTLTIIFLANIFIKGDGADHVELLVFSIALAVSVVPEALPVIMTVALSRGAVRLAQKKVVVKRLSAIEDLGSIEVLCTDKTGTLTENMLSVADVLAPDRTACLTAAFQASLEVPETRAHLHDAFDLALFQSLSADERMGALEKERIGSIPFDPERRRNSVFVKDGNGRGIIVRGAPEEILRLSHGMDRYTRMQATEFVAAAGRKGQRVIAVASRQLNTDEKCTAYSEQNLAFLGLIAFSDTLKKTAKRTIAEARSLNVAVKILTGDSREVAGSVGYAIGLIDDPEKVFTGKELDEMPYEERRDAVFSGSVFARVSPQQKHDIIKLLQERYGVGFLGEGINDAPALKLADVAIVVDSASDIARETADVVLLQKSLEALIDGIREGRAIFANILKYLKITLTSNFGNFYSVALASLLLPFVPLLPVQILLLNLLSDFPMIAIATDTVDKAELDRPKSYQMHTVIYLTTLFGVVSSVFDFMLFGYFYRISPEALQTAWFMLSVITEVVLIFSLRTSFAFFKARRPSFGLMFFSFAALIIAVVLPFTPLGETLHFARLETSSLVFIGFLAAGYFAVTELVKRMYERHLRQSREASATSAA